MARRIEIYESSGNVFADLGLPNAEEHMIKAKLVVKIDAIMREQRLKQVEAAKLFDLKQSDVSKMLRGHFPQFSVERLMHFLIALGQECRDCCQATSRHENRTNAACCVRFWFNCNCRRQNL